MKRPLWLRDIEARQQEVANDANPTSEALLGVDYGEKFCGVAWSPDGSSVLPLEVFPRETVSSSMEIWLKEKPQIKKIIFGLPRDLNQKENHICQQIRAYAQTWEAKGFEILYVDERFSTRSALGPEDLSTTSRVDDLAAIHILQSYLDSL